MLQLHYCQLALGSTWLETVPATTSADQPDELLEDTFLSKLRTALEANVDNAQLMVDDICQTMGMSRTTLHNKLTALTGMSINCYLPTLRLRKAQALLAVSSLSISEVAYGVGFDDPK